MAARFPSWPLPLRGHKEADHPLPLSPSPNTAALQALLVAVSILIDVAALRHPGLLVQSKRDFQLHKSQGGGKEKRKTERKKERGRENTHTF